MYNAKRFFRIAENILDDIIKSFEMTENEWKKYSELHPNAKRENHIIVQNKNVNEEKNHSQKNDVMIYDSEYDQYLTVDDVKKEYEDLKNNGEIEAEDFNDYIENITGKNGTCQIVRKINMTDEQKKLHRMAIEGDEYDRSEISENENSHLMTLEMLVDDEDEMVRGGVASNPNTTPEMLEKLSDDDDEYVLMNVASNPNTPKNCFEKLSNHENASVRRSVAGNFNAPDEILEKMRADIDKSVAAMANMTIRSKKWITNNIDKKIKKSVKNALFYFRKVF